MLPEIILDAVLDRIKKLPKISIKNKIVGTVVRYTTDGSLPTNSSSIYNGPFVVKYGSKISAASFDANGIASDVAIYSIAKKSSPVVHAPVEKEEKTETQNTTANKNPSDFDGKWSTTSW
jgi:hypothetical protein